MSFTYSLIHVFALYIYLSVNVVVTKCQIGFIFNSNISTIYINIKKMKSSKFSKINREPKEFERILEFKNQQKHYKMEKFLSIFIIFAILLCFCVYTFGYIRKWKYHEKSTYFCLCFYSDFAIFPRFAFVFISLSRCMRSFFAIWPNTKVQEEQNIACKKCQETEAW